MQTTILCLMGPTASGKTEVSFSLAEKLNAEIISVDSALVYRQMDIGTAKPSLLERQQIPHHLIDIRDPSEPYSAAAFQQDAFEAIRTIQARGKVPLFVGGTMLYFKALQEGLSPLPMANPEVRAQLTAQAKEEGWAALHQQLALIDPAAAARISPQDQQRIGRALEVFQLTGMPMSHYWQNKNYPESFKFVNLALLPNDRSILHARIAQRFNIMLQQGLIEEVERLYRRGDLHPNLPAIRSVGYRQVWAYLDGLMNREEMHEKSIAATRQLAKRQLTWLRHWHDIIPFDCQSRLMTVEIVNYVKDLGYQP
jgi:tRNA dimethylallyltransferase